MKLHINKVLKRKKSIVFGIVILPILYSCNSVQKEYSHPYQDPGIPVEKRVASLLDLMTVEEKIMQLDMFWGREVANMDGHEAVSFSLEKTRLAMGTTGIGSVHDLYPLSSEISNQIQKYAVEETRLGIPVLFIEEGLHGYCGLGSTSFPIPLQLAAAWDTALVKQVGRAIATDTRCHGTSMILAPVLGLARDPRWGRVEETFGEDPYLSAMNAVAIVRGMQGDTLSEHNTVIAEPKHFAVHSVPEAGSNIAPVYMGEREARNSFLFPFEKAVKIGKAKGIMAAYHELDGIPCVHNKWLLTDLLRDEWGFSGFVLADLGSIRMTVNSHRTVTDTAEAMAKTLKAGLNMQFYDFKHLSFKASVLEALEKNMLTEKDLNNAVADILRVKFLLGLFEDPYIDPALRENIFHSQESQKLALKAAQQGIVLLKNDNNVLPLTDNYKKIALIGSLAESRYLGGYTNPADKGISILDALKQRAPDSYEINYEKGYGSGTDNSELITKAVALAKRSDVAVVVLGENVEVVGEGKDRAKLDLDENQMSLIRAIKETGKPVVVVFFNGRPLTINWVSENIPAIIEAWFGGEKGGLAVADILLGNVNPSGKLPVSFPRSVGQVPFYYNHKPSSKHIYVDEKNTPLYAFGHGLSYTKFEYSDLKLSEEVITPDGSVEVNVKIKNTGDVAGTEVVQLYIRDKISSVTTPVKSLRGFQRIVLKPGEEGTVAFKLGFEELALWNSEMNREVEEGEFTIMVGSASDDIRLETALWVKNN
ncbi:MAG: glycoside hydrolase family 3 C-terminal domain-containing protein [Bacteroidales bacterium]|nr:glycoside hydrolase family 3 C-terminal domain-containing protein [Bacteroidales bacterium]